MSSSSDPKVAAVPFDHDNVVSSSHSQPFKQMSIDHTGSLVALCGGNKGVTVLELDHPDKDGFRLQDHQSRSEVGVVQWNPTYARRNVLASSSSHNLTLWDVSGGTSLHTPVSSITAHSRAVAGVAWSFHEDHLLATCSADTSINLWDTRAPKAPLKLKSFRAWTAGASQVKWNRQNPVILASAHEGEVRVWDIRNDLSPMTYITAHMHKINGIDWSYQRENDLVTCGEDGLVKFWDISMSRVCQGVLNTGSSVGKACFVPLGKGLVTFAKREHFAVRLWRLSNLNSPVRSFVGHTNFVIACDWRVRRDELQLVSWSKDYTLRRWPLGARDRQSIGLDDVQPSIKTSGKSQSRHRRHQTSNRGNTTAAPRREIDLIMRGPQYTPHNLSQELSMFSTTEFPGIELTEANAMKRACTVTARDHNTNQVVQLRISFPSHYPNNAPPSFEFLAATTLPTAQKQRLKEVLTAAATAQVEQNRPCLEACLLVLQPSEVEDDNVSDLDGLDDTDSVSSTSSYSNVSSKTQGYDRECIPCPRIAGATFGANGRLVYFQNFAMTDTSPPRTYEDLKVFASEQSSTAVKNTKPDSFFAIQTYYYTDDVEDLRTPLDTIRGPKVQSHFNTSVGIYDVSRFLPISLSLARKYTLSGTTSEVCQHNAKVAAAARRPDLVQLWSLLRRITDTSVYEGGTTASTGGLPALLAVATTKAVSTANTARGGATSSGRNPASSNSAMPHQALTGMATGAPSVTAASLLSSDSPSPWVFHPFARKMVMSLFQHFRRLGDVQTIAMLSCILAVNTDQSERKGTSLSVFGVDLQTDRMSLTGKRVDASSTSLLDARYRNTYERCKECYADILYRWGELDRAVEVLKYTHITVRSHIGIEFGVVCRVCGEECDGSVCSGCSCYGMTCSICHVAVRGLSSFCSVCMHGGHVKHMRNWFSEEEQCPTGCGCKCLEASRSKA